MVVQPNLRGYDPGKAPLDLWILSMVFHSRRRRVGNTLPSTIGVLRGEKEGESSEWTYDIGSLEALYQALQQYSQVHRDPSLWTPSHFVLSLTSLQRALGVSVVWIPGQRDSE